MDKSNILLRLEMLVDLCETTEPEVPNDKQLFSNHLIEVMRSSNKIWKFRNKIKNGEVDTIDHAEMIDEIEDYLAQGQKINAIKYYREEMKERYDEQVGLRESKDFVDSIDNDLKRRGIVRYR